MICLKLPYTYWTVEYHKTLVKMVVLHCGVAVQLGQWMVTSVKTVKYAASFSFLHIHILLLITQADTPN